MGEQMGKTKTQVVDGMPEQRPAGRSARKPDAHKVEGLIEELKRSTLLAGDGEDDVEKPRKVKTGGGRGGPLNEYGLTAKQEQLARLLVTTNRTEVDCFREVYDAKNVKPATAYHRVWTIKQNPVFRQRLDMLREELKKRTQRDEGRIRSTVLNILFDCVEAPTSTWKDKLRAAELLGKVDSVGLWVARSEQTIDDRRSSADLSKELQDKLARMLGPSMIDTMPVSSNVEDIVPDNSE